MKKARKPVKKRKKQKIGRGAYFASAVLALLIIVSAVMIIRSNIENARIAATGAKIYFYDPQSHTLKPEYRPITEGTNTEKVKFVLEELAIGPKNSTFQVATLPYILESAVISGDNVNVRFSSGYYELSADEEMILRASLVCTLTDLPFVESVTINIEGIELLKPNGQPLGKMTASDIVLAPDINPQGASPKTITLYFADEAYSGLVAEYRTIAVNPNEPIARYIVNELIRGPGDDGLLPTVPPETKLIEIDIADGVCNVDLSKEFVTKNTGAPGTEELSIYSIVNSLCELSDVKNVQFMIESKRQEQFKDETGFDSLYEAKELPPSGVR